MSDKFTWRQLRDIANGVPEELLDNQVMGWPEDDEKEISIMITGHEVLKENWRDNSDNAVEPESGLKNSLPADEFTDEDFPIVYHAGTRILTYK